MVLATSSGSTVTRSASRLVATPEISSVRVSDGAIVVTWTPCGGSSWSSASPSATTAALVAQ